MKRFTPLLLAALLLAACDQSAEDFWTAETCNTRLEMDIVDFEKYRAKYADAQEAMDRAARSGDASQADTLKKNAQSYKDATTSLLKFIDSNIAPHCEGKFRQDLLAEVEKARTFAAEGMTAVADEEGMPDLRVSGIESVFVPYELDANGGCSGPYLNLTLTVSNSGGDFPRPVDLQTYEERAQRPSKELLFFTAIGELDFGGDMKKRLDFPIMGATGTLKAGSSLTIPAKVRIEHNQQRVTVKGSIAGAAFLKIGDAAPYETEIDIPLWDIYTFSHQVLAGKDQKDGKTYLGAKATVTNLGKTPTPGPVDASFIIQEVGTKRKIASWSNKTDSPVSGNTDLYAKIPFSGTLPPQIEVYSSIIPLCPDGNAGNLADGNTANNIRTLVQRQ